jgi:hypothetical protein
LGLPDRQQLGWGLIQIAAFAGIRNKLRQNAFGGFVLGRYQDNQRIGFMRGCSV